MVNTTFLRHLPGYLVAPMIKPTPAILSPATIHLGARAGAASAVE
jgi:hypothetical protein